MHGRLLVTDQDVAQPGLPVECVIERQGRAAGIAEQRVDAAFDQRVEQQLGAVAEGCERFSDAGRDGLFREHFHATNFSGFAAECASEIR